MSNNSHNNVRAYTYTYNIQFSADYRNFVRITAIHETNWLRQKENADCCSRQWHTRRGPTRRRCLKGVLSRYISSHGSGLAYSELARKRENIQTGRLICRSWQASDNLRPRNSRRSRKSNGSTIFTMLFSECYLLRRTATFVPLAVVKDSERAPWFSLSVRLIAGHLFMF